MSEYFLADRKAEERAKQRATEEVKPHPRSQDIKVTLLGDFLFPSGEPQGCDPYNSTYGRAARQAWQSRRDRR
jgi:hypothetical protein